MAATMTTTIVGPPWSLSVPHMGPLIPDVGRQDFETLGCLPPRCTPECKVVVRCD